MPYLLKSLPNPGGMRSKRKKLERVEAKMLQHGANSELARTSAESAVKATNPTEPTAANSTPAQAKENGALLAKPLQIPRTKRFSMPKISITVQVA